jgi:hypothetical protein
MSDAHSVPLEVDGVTFDLRIWPDPSGLRGQVFWGEEKIAGVQIYHDTAEGHLVEAARRDPAVRRAVERLRA